jgi:hypothetical protein
MRPSIAGALGALGRLAELLEHLVEALNLLFRLFEMVSQPLGQVAVGCLVDEFRKGFNNLVFRRALEPAA